MYMYMHMCMLLHMYSLYMYYWLAPSLGGALCLPLSIDHSLEEEGDEEIVPTFPCHSSTLWNISVSSRALSRLCLIIEGTWRLL